MKKSIILTVIAASALGIAACGQTTSPTALPEVVKVQNVENNSITVNSKEEVKVVPDIAQLEFGVTTEAADAESCQTKNAEETNKVITLLKSLGLEDTQIQTNGYGLNPQYDWSGNSQKLIGYEMTTNITLTGLPIDQVGKLINDSVTSGVNQINSITYKSSNYDTSYQEALTLAVASAKTKAEAIAAASGSTLGPVISVEELNNNTDPRYTNYNTANKEMALDSAAGSPAVMPGQLAVEAHVIVSFQIQ